MIVGVDPSSKSVTAAVLTDEPYTFIGVQKAVFPRKGKWAPEDAVKACDACRLVFDTIGMDDGARLYLESPVVGAGGPNPTIVQSFVSGIIQLVAQEYGAQVVLVNNQTWKKRVIGNGNAKKDLIIGTLRREYPKLESYCGDDDDLYDACGLAIYGASTESGT